MYSYLVNCGCSLHYLAVIRYLWAEFASIMVYKYTILSSLGTNTVVSGKKFLPPCFSLSFLSLSFSLFLSLSLMIVIPSYVLITYSHPMCLINALLRERLCSRSRFSLSFLSPALSLPLLPISRSQSLSQESQQSWLAELSDINR